MPPVYRILDANANRAREAIRVMEDAARFLLDDQSLSKALKQLRHDLAEALSSIKQLTQWRNTPGDVGTTITTPTELTRTSAADVAAAAAKRLTEALRTLEEYTKILPLPSNALNNACGLAQSLEQLRYRAYTLEQQLTTALATGRRQQWKLCVLLSESLCPNRDWLKVAKAVVESGGDCIQLREKTLDAGELLERAKQLVDLCHSKGVSVIVNDRPDVALLAGADGVHLGQTDLPAAEVRKLVGNQLLIGVSTSNINEAKQALTDGADYCGVGPMFPTTTKHKPEIAGPEYLRQYLAWNKRPHLAIGGITLDNLPQLVKAGAQGIAVSSAICAADDPQVATKQILSAFKHSGPL